MATLLPVLVRGVNDNDAQSRLGTCKALQGLLSERANETKLYVDKLIDINLEEITKIKDDTSPVLQEQLKSVCILAKEHFEPVLNHLHRLKPPLSR